MKLLSLLTATLFLNASALAAPPKDKGKGKVTPATTTTTTTTKVTPTPEPATVTCRPTLVDDKKPKPKNFLVSTRTARSEAEKAKFPERTKSGDPHRYFNGDGLVFGKPHCDTDAELWEYPVFWTAVKKTWNMNELTRNQPATPIRVVYAKVGGEVQYCGVMTHSQVDKDNRGKAFFQLCT